MTAVVEQQQLNLLPVFEEFEPGLEPAARCACLLRGGPDRRNEREERDGNEDSTHGLSFREEAAKV